MVLRLKTRESRSLPGLPRGEASISSLLHANKAAALQSAGLVLREPPAPHHCPTATPGPISPPMARAPKDTTPRPRPSRGKSGKPPAPPVEGLAGTPQTKRSAHARFDPPAGQTEESARGGTRSTLPALRQVGPPSRSVADMTASLNALLAKPQERSERAQQVLAQQPMLAMHPLVSGENPPFAPHRPPRPQKSEGGIPFNLESELEPRGDQPAAIDELVQGISAQERNQVLLGVTGSGKTYTMAQVIAHTGRPALVLAPNKTLAAQLYGEFKSFFPHNAVEYFVSYYDYYQPEAYVPRTDTY